MKIKRSQILLALVLLVCLVWLLWGNLTVGLTRVTITEKNLPVCFQGYRIAHVSDLHNSHLWKQTLEHLQKEKPDIICITGDIVDGSRTDIDTALRFVAEAMKLAPCYYITGNHELALKTADYEKLISGLKSLGVTVLDNEAVLLERGDEQIRLVGVSWGSSAYMGELSEHDGYQILLAHAPEHFESYAQAGFDLVLSGHAHGGQFRLAILGGMYAPGQGLWPKYDSGVHRAGNADMVISRGIGNSVIPVRVNNRPEVIIITLQS